MTLSDAQQRHDLATPECVDATDDYLRVERAWRRAADAVMRRTPVCVLYTGRAGDLVMEVGDVEILGDGYQLSVLFRGPLNGTEGADLAEALETMAGRLRKGTVTL